MEIINKRYTIIGRNGERYRLTAKELYEGVMKDSKSDYDWIALAPELVKVCNKSSFPKEYAESIKLAILKCFTNLEVKGEYDPIIESENNMAVYSCYNSLVQNNEKVVLAKQKYLECIIRNVAFHYFSIPIHEGPKFSKMREKWIEEKFKENVTKEKIYFSQLIKDLNSDYSNLVKIAEENGIFEEDNMVKDKELEKRLNLMFSNKIK